MAGHLIRRLHQQSGQVFQSRMQDAGLPLTQVQFAALTAVRDNPGVDQAGLAALIAYDRATIGGVADRLEAKGWIARRVSARDRRAREVRLTAAGAQVLAAADPVVRALQADILGELSPEERRTFEDLARRALGLPSDGQREQRARA